MKKIMVILVLFGLAKQWAAAQESTEKVSFTTGELRAGYGVTRFGEGLKEAYEAGGFGLPAAACIRWRSFTNLPAFRIPLILLEDQFPAEFADWLADFAELLRLPTRIA